MQMCKCVHSCLVLLVWLAGGQLVACTHTAPPPPSPPGPLWQIMRALTPCNPSPLQTLMYLMSYDGHPCYHAATESCHVWSQCCLTLPLHTALAGQSTGSFTPTNHKYLTKWPRGLVESTCV